MSVALLKEIKFAYQSVLEKGWDITSRTSRREFWLFYGPLSFVRFSFVALITVSTIMEIRSVAPEMMQEVAAQISPLPGVLLSVVFAFVDLCYSLPASIRRFQDSDRGGMACYFNTGYSALVALYSLALYLGALTVSPTSQLALTKYLSLPVLVLSIYVLYVLCLKGCTGRNNYGLPA